LLCRPAGLAFDSQRSLLYVADMHNHRIQARVLSCCVALTPFSDGVLWSGLPPRVYRSLWLLWLGSGRFPFEPRKKHTCPDLALSMAPLPPRRSHN
jgi:hypothetical protein